MARLKVLKEKIYTHAGYFRNGQFYDDDGNVISPVMSKGGEEAQYRSDAGGGENFENADIVGSSEQSHSTSSEFKNGEDNPEGNPGEGQGKSGKKSSKGSKGEQGEGEGENQGEGSEESNEPGGDTGGTSGGNSEGGSGKGSEEGEGEEESSGNNSSSGSNSSNSNSNGESGGNQSSDDENSVIEPNPKQTFIDQRSGKKYKWDVEKKVFYEV